MASGNGSLEQTGVDKGHGWYQYFSRVEQAIDGSSRNQMPYTTYGIYSYMGFILSIDFPFFVLYTTMNAVTYFEDIVDHTKMKKKKKSIFHTDN